MNDRENLPSDALDDFINAHQQGKSPATPPIPEAHFASDLLDMGDKIRLPDDFHSAMLSEFGTSPPFSDDADDVNTPLQRRIIRFPREKHQLTPAQQVRRRRHGGWFPFVMSLAMMGMVLIGIFALSNIRHDPPTGGYPTLQENRLPLQVGGFVERASPSILNTMTDTGMTWVAYTVRYSEPDAEADLRRAREMIDSARQNGLQIMIRLIGIAPELTNYGYEYFQIFGDFSGQLAQLGPDAIQVWHRPNVDNVWYINQMNALDYVNMLRVVSARIRAVDDDIMIISAAPAPAGASSFSSNLLADDLYYRDMAAAGITDYVDCIGVTYTEGIVPPNATSGDPREQQSAIVQNTHETLYLGSMLDRAARSFLNNDVPLCVTDLGYLAPEDFEQQITQTYAWAHENTVQEQANWLRDALILIDEYEPLTVELAIIWHVQYAYNESPMNGYAIIRPDNSCPACDTIATLLE